MPASVKRNARLRWGTTQLQINAATANNRPGCHAKNDNAPATPAQKNRRYARKTMQNIPAQIIGSFASGPSPTCTPSACDETSAAALKLPTTISQTFEESLATNCV